MTQEKKTPTAELKQIDELIAGYQKKWSDTMPSKRGSHSLQRLVGRHSWALLILGDCLDVLNEIVCDVVVRNATAQGYNVRMSLRQK